jgi:hypothetical protein
MSDSISTHKSSAMRSISSGSCKNIPPLGFKSGIYMFTQCENSSDIGSQKTKAGNISDHKRISSARGRIFSPRTAVLFFAIKDILIKQWYYYNLADRESGCCPVLTLTRPPIA